MGFELDHLHDALASWREQSQHQRAALSLALFWANKLSYQHDVEFIKLYCRPDVTRKNTLTGELEIALKATRRQEAAFAKSSLGE